MNRNPKTRPSQKRKQAGTTCLPLGGSIYNIPDPMQCPPPTFLFLPPSLNLSPPLPYPFPFHPPLFPLLFIPFLPFPHHSPYFHFSPLSLLPLSLPFHAPLPPPLHPPPSRPRVLNPWDTPPLPIYTSLLCVKMAYRSLLSYSSYSCCCDCDISRQQHHCCVF